MASKSTRARTAGQRPTSQVIATATGPSTPTHGSILLMAGPQVIDAEALKLELLATLRQDIVDIFKTEL